MRSIKSFTLSALLTIGAFGAVTYTSCNRDECKDVVCNDGGNCVDGTCVCVTGYEGATCDVESRAKFIKNWTASDVVHGATLLYTVPVAAGTNVTDVIIGNNFSDDFFANSVRATVDGNTITIPDQEPDANGDYRVEGTGTYQSNGTILWDYTITRETDGVELVHTGTWN